MNISISAPDAPKFTFSFIGEHMLNVTWQRPMEAGEKAGSIYYVEYKKIGKNQMNNVQTIRKKLFLFSILEKLFCSISVFKSHIRQCCNPSSYTKEAFLLYVSDVTSLQVHWKGCFLDLCPQKSLKKMLQSF